MEIGEDGAPLWAIVPPPTELLQGPLKDLFARRQSKQVLDAFDTFFGDAPDGPRLRSRFGTMAAAVAARFKDEPGVVGIELYNEPVATDDLVVRFHREIIPAVRAAAPKKVILFEPSAFRNFLDTALIGNGSLDPGSAYAPHVYTFSFSPGGDENGVFPKEKLRPSNVAARAEADGWQAPLVITEYGFDPKRAGYLSYVQGQHALQDEMRASRYYWVWKENSQDSWGFFSYAPESGFTERPDVVDVMSWVRLEAVAGLVETINYDPSARRLRVTFEGAAAITAPNLVSVGRAKGFGSIEAKCDGATVPVTKAEPLVIPCNGDGAHELIVEGR